MRVTLLVMGSVLRGLLNRLNCDGVNITNVAVIGNVHE
nr:hypothetical protein [Providencia rettgeri]